MSVSQVFLFWPNICVNNRLVLEFRGLFFRECLGLLPAGTLRVPYRPMPAVLSKNRRPLTYIQNTGSHNIIGDPHMGHFHHSLGCPSPIPHSAPFMAEGNVPSSITPLSRVAVGTPKRESPVDVVGRWYPQSPWGHQGVHPSVHHLRLKQQHFLILFPIPFPAIFRDVKEERGRILSLLSLVTNMPTML